MNLDQKERLLSIVLNEINDAVIATEVNDCVTFMNPIAEALTGWKFEKGEGQQLNKIFNITRNDLKTKMHSQIEEEGGIDYPIDSSEETHLVNKDGNKVPVDIHVTPIMNHENRVSGRVIIFRDISEQKRMEEEKKRIQAQLIHAQKLSALGKLIGGVAHDFNNLITIIQIVAQMSIEQIGEKGSPSPDDLRQIQNAAERAAKLTRQLLIYSRTQSKRLTSFNINTTIESLLEMLHRLIGMNITVNTCLKPDIWSILANEGHIEQVIMNLIINARDAMPDGGEITVRTENVILSEDNLNSYSPMQPGKYVCLSIIDTGIGMNIQTRRRIFDSYFSNKKKGTGIGLSVVYDIVQGLRGSINVQSEEGKGSTFQVYLPVDSRKSKKYENQEESTTGLQGDEERILLVEDEDTLCRSLARILRQNGYNVYTALNMKEALNIYEREGQAFHLVLSDIVLPDGNGLDLIDRLRLLRPELRVLLSSGYSDSKWYWAEIRKRGLPVLDKPFSIPNLLKTVKETIQIQNEQATNI